MQATSLLMRGLLHIAHELRGYVKEEGLAQVAKIYETVKYMLEIARKAGISEEQAVSRNKRITQVWNWCQGKALQIKRSERR